MIKKNLIIFFAIIILLLTAGSLYFTDKTKENKEEYENCIKEVENMFVDLDFTFDDALNHKLQSLGLGQRAILNKQDCIIWGWTDDDCSDYIKQRLNEMGLEDGEYYDKERDAWTIFRSMQSKQNECNQNKKSDYSSIILVLDVFIVIFSLIILILTSIKNKNQ